MIASDTLFDTLGVFWVKLSDEDVADFEVLREVAMATMCWLSVHGLHIGATEPCICGGDAALCQITLTTCSYLFWYVFCCLLHFIGQQLAQM